MLICPSKPGTSRYIVPFLILNVPMNISLIGILIKSILDKNLYPALTIGLTALVSFESWFCMMMYFIELKFEERKVSIEINSFQGSTNKFENHWFRFIATNFFDFYLLEKRRKILFFVYYFSKNINLYKYIQIYCLSTILIFVFWRFILFFLIIYLFVFFLF